MKQICAILSEKTELNLFAKIVQEFDEKIEKERNFEEDEQAENNFNSIWLLLNLFDSVIDFEESKTQKKLVCKPGIDEQLDQLKLTYSSISSLLVSNFF